MSLVSSLFGARQTNLADLMASRTGIRPQSASSLLALIVPFVLHMVGREASAAGGFNASSIARLLGDQMGFVRSALPAGLGSILGLGGVEEPAHAYEAPHEAARSYKQPVAAEPARAYEHGGGMGWLKWAIPLLVLGLLVSGATALRHRDANRQVAASAGSPIGTTGTVALVKQRLSCGQELDDTGRQRNRRIDILVTKK
jgi:hypothetical protein